MVLRRRTTNAIVAGMLVFTSIALVLGALALVCRPETRLVAPCALALASLGLNAFAGERVTSKSFAAYAALTLPIVLGGLAVYEAHVRWDLALGSLLFAFAAMVVLFFAFFLRALIASGSADYPYDD